MRNYTSSPLWDFEKFRLVPSRAHRSEAKICRLSHNDNDKRVCKIKWNTKHIALSEEFQSLIENGRNNFKIDTSNTYIHDRFLYLGWYRHSIKRCRVKQKLVNRRRTDNTMTKRKRTTGQTTIYKTLQRKQN
jgi:hypothetical protein